jgi:hypothetical protein
MGNGEPAADVGELFEPEVSVVLIDSESALRIRTEI